MYIKESMGSVEPPDEILVQAIDVSLEKHQVKYKLRACSISQNTRPT